MENLYRAYKDKAEFYFVYVLEAHPDDGWQVQQNKKDGVIYKKPDNLNDRARIAGDCVKSLGLTIPCMLDDMANSALKLYKGWPARVCVIDISGKITYLSPASPHGINPPDIENALKQMIAYPK